MLLISGMLHSDGRWLHRGPVYGLLGSILISFVFDGCQSFGLQNKHNQHGSSEDEAPWFTPDTEDNGTGFVETNDPTGESFQAYYLRRRGIDRSSAGAAHLISRWYHPSGPACRFNLSILAESTNSIANRTHPFDLTLTAYVRSYKRNDSSFWNSTVLSLRNWLNYSVHVGNIPDPFRIVVEVSGASWKDIDSSFYTVIRLFALENCDPGSGARFRCGLHEFRCNQSNASEPFCIPIDQVCDQESQCPPSDESDEDREMCESVQRKKNACDFETDECEWRKKDAPTKNGKPLTWERHRGPVPGPHGPFTDHSTKTDNGTFLFFDTKHGGFNSRALVSSPLFPIPPSENWDQQSPYYATCKIRFYFYMNNMHSFRLNLHIFERNQTCCQKRDNDTNCWSDIHENLWTVSGHFTHVKNFWQRAVVTLPEIHRRYMVVFEGVKGVFRGDIAIDDFSMTEECFGRGIMRKEEMENLSDTCIKSAHVGLNYKQLDDIGWQVDLTGATLLGFLLLTITISLVFSLLYIWRCKKQDSFLLNGAAHGSDRSNPLLNLQLASLRAEASKSLNFNNVLRDYNPTYDFGGIRCSLDDLKTIPRTNITLVKALGHGAFGEVYQGTLEADQSQMQVAVKTLPAITSDVAAKDFLMEALITSRFDHPNVVKLFGVCFEKQPQLMVLELLEGGDVKTFLQEIQSNSNSAEITNQDLLHLALDVAKGCSYLETNHFIHRDIAARNCLITTKTWGRQTKIADFGMARKIFRSDSCYKKSGNAMIPVRWMPPEALQEGLFTAKTDVWSYGMLLWEIYAFGSRPYPGLSNKEVIRLITNGGRQEIPRNCPYAVVDIMTVCWAMPPSDRPKFDRIVSLLEECLKRSDIIRAPLFIGSAKSDSLKTSLKANPEKSFTNATNRTYLSCTASTDSSIDEHVHPTATSTTCDQHRLRLELPSPPLPHRHLPVSQHLGHSGVDVSNHARDEYIAPETNQRPPIAERQKINDFLICI